MAAGSRFRFICLTDAPGLASVTWECRLVRSAFALDPIRNGLYIDNSIVLTSPPCSTNSWRWRNSAWTIRGASSSS
jgi:hypothetical protein